MSDQTLEGPGLRRFLKLEEEESGVLVRRVAYQSSADGVIEPGDVLLQIAGHRIANNGTVRYRGRYRTHYRVFLGDHDVGTRSRSSSSATVSSWAAPSR